jgi:hypothetical protein
MRFRMLRLVICWVACLASAGAANTFYLANQGDWPGKRGFYVSLECRHAGDESCRLQMMKLVMGVADGEEWRFITAQPEWQFDRSYKLKAVITGNDARLWLDGKEVGSSAGGFAPLDRDLTLNEMPIWDSSAADYLVFVDSVGISSGGRTKQVCFPESARPMGLVVFDSQSPRRVAWRTQAGQPVTLDAEFRLVKRPDIASLAPYIDRYGQCRYADWPGKIRSDDDLRKSVDDEDVRLRKMGEVTGYDKYGGCLAAGWTEKPTGFYRITKRDGFWWLVTPEGNPCFYVGLCTVSPEPWESTLITGRESLFESLPPKTSLGWIKNAMGEKSACDYLAFAGPNMMTKYGQNWKYKLDNVARRRVKTWGFSGVGKWGELKGMPVVPVLNRGGVPNVVDHPDVFDPDVRAKFEEALRKQIEPRLNDPMVVGWSLGNEIAEIIKATEIEQILGEAEPSPIKRALVDHALNLCSGDAEKLAASWKQTAATADGLYAASLKAPAEDVERLRQFYASSYYEFIYRTVKKIDPSHLYFGFWVVPGWWENESDWRV